MHRQSPLAAAAATALAAAAAALAGSALAQTAEIPPPAAAPVPVPGYGPGAMGRYGMGPGVMGDGRGMTWGYGRNMMGPGMMGGSGPGMMDWAWRPGAQGDVGLRVKDVAAHMDRWLAMTGDPRVRLGPVVQTDADTITADVVTTDTGGLVQRFAFDRHTGVARHAGG